MAGQDTAAPPIPDDPSYPDDSLFVVTRPGKELPVYFRRLATVRFDDSTSGFTVRAFFAAFQARIVGGSVFNRTYIFQFPDPGPSWAEFDAIVNRMNSEAGIELVSQIVRVGLPPVIESK
jgi:hypothetical protein